MTRITRDQLAGLIVIAIGLAIAFALAGCTADRGFSTASPDVTVTKSNEVHFHGKVVFPSSLDFTGPVPAKKAEESSMAGFFNQRHNADSDTGLESTLENATRLQDMLNPELDGQLNTGGGAGSQ